ncbi:NAD(P)-binding protein [Multifurca ochricompacta]|uniref:NAD(P)-binding protein n=1 Tax=Multifurca ochricompacta TaxID=376703 RepID=A0AAD4M7V7_9AGAM|nr:NAD(P)-binding protein [Multifurca ochricompacta]
MGSLISLAQQSYPPHPTWSANDIPDLTGKVAIVTGGNTGVGRETVKELLNHNAKVYLAARSTAKAIDAIKELKDETGKEANFLQLDLADLLSVRKSATDFLVKETQLHILVNNAGVMICPKEDITAQKFDQQFGTNVIGHWLFTQLLLPALFAATDASPTQEKARVVTVSSSANYLTKGLDFEAFVDGPKRRTYEIWELYNKSKFGNVVVARELARRHGDKIVSTSLNPGNIKSDLQRNMPRWQLALISWMLYPVSYGALTQLYCATAPAVADLNGHFFIPWARSGKPHPDAEDPQIGEKLWTWLEEETKKY